MSALRRLLYLTAVALFAIAPLAQAQVTTGTIAGTVLAADGSALPGVTVEAIHVPTGTRYDSVTGSNGRFTIPNVRVGGPYRVTATLEGFRTAEAAPATVPLGGAAEIPLTLQLATVSEAITVTATADDVINPNRTGSTSAVSEEQIESLPTVNRSLQDFARTNPYFTVDAQDISSTRMYVAGKNNRYNTIQIDGAVNNDLFGLADTGTPGGQADAQPISIDAIQEIQLVVSPYDVRQGGFTGGGVNAITRSGSNEFNGSVFYTQRNESFIGEDSEGEPFNDFEYEQYGGRLGGPILRDRLFFFVTGEQTSRSEPTGVSADGSAAGTQYNDPELAAAVRNFLIERFDYDPGSLGDFPEKRDADNLFGRLDWNIGSSNQLTLRHNYVNGYRDVISDRNEFEYRFQTATYAFASETNSTVAQLNSTLGANAYNEARVGLQTIRDSRAVPVRFPSIEVGGSPRNADIYAGTERFSGANALDQDILEITDDFTWLTGNHTLTFGTHNEFFEFKNLFMSEALGYYFFPTLEDLQNLDPRDYSITRATGDDPRRATQFEVAQFGFYVSDQWRLNPSLSFTLGLRADMPRFGDTPSFNERVQNAIGQNTAQMASEDPVFSPRFGFNWQPGANATQQVRGGIGVFAGRTPYVWISNAFAGTGVEQIALSCNKAANCDPQFVADPDNQPVDFPAGGGAFSVDLIDPDFKLPHVLRATLGYDRELFFGINGTAEVVWSRNLEDVYYVNLNKRPSGTSPLDGRPRYTNVSTQMRDAVQLTNTDKGEQRIFSLQLNKRFDRGVTLAASYANQDATSAFDGTSSRAISNWQFHHTQGDIFNPQESRSAFETEHRLNISGSWDVQTGFLDHTFALYYNAQSGRPYSLLFGTDINGDGYSTNDLLYLPPADGVIIQGNSNSDWKDTGISDYDQWIKYLEAAGVENPTSGRIMDRYELTEPWVRQLDFSYQLGLPLVSRFRSMLTVDVMNVLNLFDSDYGRVEFVSNQNFSPVTFVGIDAATGKPIYRERFANALEEKRQFNTADLRSTWQARVGLRVSF